MLTMFCSPGAGMKVKQTVDKMATVADSLGESGTLLSCTLNLTELRPADYALTVDVYWTLVMFCFFALFIMLL